MEKINCPSREGCAAPLCPLEPGPDAQWFPDEDICHTRTFRQAYWVDIQRKIKRRYMKGQIDNANCFTIPMLQSKIRVRHPKGILPEDLNRNGISKPC